MNLREKIADMQKQINELVAFLKDELGREPAQQPEVNPRGLVKSPSANLVRLAQIIAERQQQPSGQPKTNPRAETSK